MKKLIVAIISFCLIMLISPTVAIGEEISPETKIEEYDFSAFESLFDKVSDSISVDSFADFSKKLLSGDVDSAMVLNGLLNVVFSDIKKMLPLVASLVALTLVYGVFGNAKGDFISKELSSALIIAFSLSVAMLLGIYATDVFKTASFAINNMKSQMDISFPFLIMLLVASGGELTVSGVQPVLCFLSVTLTGVITNVVQPLAVFSFALSLFSKLSEKTDLSHTAELSSNIAKSVLTASVVIYTAYLAIAGSYSISRDKVAYKAAKYALSQSVPIIGSYIKEGIDMAIVCSVEIKNAVGIASLILFIALSLSPIIKCFGLSFVIRLSQSIASPFSDKNALSIYESVAKSMDLVGSSLLCVTFMYMEAVFVFIVATGYIV